MRRIVHAGRSGAALNRAGVLAEARVIPGRRRRYSDRKIDEVAIRRRNLGRRPSVGAESCTSRGHGDSEALGEQNGVRGAVLLEVLRISYRSAIG